MGSEIILPESMEDAIFMGCSGLGVGSIIRTQGKRIRFVPDERYERYKLQRERHCYQGCSEINLHLAKLCDKLEDYYKKCPTCKKYRGGSE